MDETRRFNRKFEGCAMIGDVMYECAGCGRPIREGGSVLFDENTEQYFHDDQCFQDWCGMNPEIIEEYYKRLNVVEELL